MLQPTGFPNYFLFFNVEKDNFQLINNSYIYMYMLLRIFFVILKFLFQQRVKII